MYRRRYAPRRRVIRRRRSTRFARRSSRRFTRKSSRARTALVKRTRFINYPIPDFPTFNSGNIDVSLSDLDAYSELTNLYREYRISKVSLTFTWDKQRPAGATTVTPGPNDNDLMFYVYRNREGRAKLADLAEVNQISRKFQKMLLNPGKVGKMSFTPTVSTTVYQSAVSSAYAPKAFPFLDAAYATVPGYGVSFALSNSATGGTSTGVLLGTLGVQMTYYIRLRTLK